jgi:hypothetical protein
MKRDLWHDCGCGFFSLQCRRVVAIAIVTILVLENQLRHNAGPLATTQMTNDDDVLRESLAYDASELQRKPVDTITDRLWKL